MKGEIALHSFMIYRKRLGSVVRETTGQQEKRTWIALWLLNSAVIKTIKQPASKGFEKLDRGHSANC